MEIQSLCPLLQVYDMYTSLHFYVGILGFEVRDSAGEKDDPGWVWLTRQDVNLMLNTQYETPARPGSPDSVRKANHRDTILYLGCPDVDGAYAELMDKGCDPEPPQITPYGMKQLYLSDPDGYGICFQWRA